MPNFMIVADENYATVLRTSLQKIHEFYPDSRVFLYDWGLEKETESELRKKYSNLTIVDWSQRLQEIRDTIRKDPIGVLAKVIHKYMPKYVRYVVDRKSRLSLYEFERIIIEKLFCLKHCSEQARNDKIFWFDADVVLIAPIPEIIDADYDFIFTMRRENEIEFKRNSCQVINTGVIFIGDVRQKREVFIDEWIERTKVSREYLREQTAVTRMLEENGRDVFQKYSTFDHDINGIKISVKIQPCEVYNFNWIEEAVKNPNKLKNVKILHFKGRRHNPDHFNDLMTKLRIP